MSLVARAAVAPCEILLSIQQGGRVQELRYSYRNPQLRIDHLGKIIPSPAINLLDLKTGMLSIIHPHNGTWEQGSISGISDPVLDSPIPAIEERPRMDPPSDWPEIPKELPSGIGPGAAQAPLSAAGVPGMPAFPAMPDFPMAGMGVDEPLTLVALNQTNELSGFSCRLYEATVSREGTLTLWLCDDPRLPPFYLLKHELPHSQERPEWNDRLAERLREEKLFPFKVELKGEGDDTLAQWRVLFIKTDVKEKDQAGIFKIPEEMHRIHGAF